MQTEGQPVGKGGEREDVGSRGISHHGVQIRPGDGSRREIVGIVSGATTVENVTADTGIEGIIPSPADEGIVARSADE